MINYLPSSVTMTMSLLESKYLCMQVNMLTSINYKDLPHLLLV